MAQIVEVRFKGTRKGFYTWPNADDRLRLSEPVIVEAERGLDFGRVSAVGEAAAAKCGSCSSCATGEAKAEANAGATIGTRVEVEPDSRRPNGHPEESPQAEPNRHPEESPQVEPARHPEESPQAATKDRPAGEPILRSAQDDQGARGDQESEPATEFHPILRRATQQDVRAANDLRRNEETDRQAVVAKVREHGLAMKVSDAEWQFDRSRLTIYFTAEQRVDFRTLVKELAGRFRARIELRQIGVRDEAARIGGVGRCGREYCCSTWLTDLSPVNLALAKDQNLSLNPTQISGGCGRLLCCLKYEHEFYVAARKRFPKDGKTLRTVRGAEKVIAVDIFRERVFLRGEEGSRIVPLVQLQEEMEEAGRQEGGSVSVEAAAPRATPAAQPPRPERERRPERTQPPRERPAAPKPPATPTPTVAPPEAAATASPSPDAAADPARRKKRRRRRRKGPRPDAPPESSPDTQP